MDSEKFSIKSRLKSFKYAFHGIFTLLKNEHNSRIHLFAALVAIIAGAALGIDRYEWSLLFIVTGIVFITELLNSAIESLADIVHPEYNKLIKIVKDYSAAAVLISAIIALITGCLIFIPKLISGI